MASGSLSMLQYVYRQHKLDLFLSFFFPFFRGLEDITRVGVYLEGLRSKYNWDTWCGIPNQSIKVYVGKKYCVLLSSSDFIPNRNSFAFMYVLPLPYSLFSCGFLTCIFMSKNFHFRLQRENSSVLPKSFWTTRYSISSPIKFDLLTSPYIHELVKARLKWKSFYIKFRITKHWYVKLVFLLWPKEN